MESGEALREESHLPAQSQPAWRCCHLLSQWPPPAAAAGMAARGSKAEGVPTDPSPRFTPRDRGREGPELDACGGRRLGATRLRSPAPRRRPRPPGGAGEPAFGKRAAGQGPPPAAPLILRRTSHPPPRQRWRRDSGSPGRKQRSQRGAGELSGPAPPRAWGREPEGLGHYRTLRQEQMLTTPNCLSLRPYAKSAPSSCFVPVFLRGHGFLEDRSIRHLCPAQSGHTHPMSPSCPTHRTWCSEKVGWNE